MGVMGCSRSNCENIMCDTYVDGIGYVCYDCQKEFEIYLENKEESELSEGEIRQNLKIFIYTPKDDYSGENMSVGNFFNKHSN